LRYWLRPKDSSRSAEAAKLVEEAGGWWRDLVLAVHRVAGAPTCFLYHWYEGHFATEIVRPRSWSLIDADLLDGTTFHTLDFDQAFAVR